MSTCDSTFSKCLGEDRDDIILQILNLGKDCSNKISVLEVDAPYTLFGSNLSTPSTDFKDNATLTSTVEMSLLPATDFIIIEADPVAVHVPMTTTVPDLSENSTVDMLPQMEPVGVEAVPMVPEKLTAEDADFFEIDKDDPLLQPASCTFRLLKTLEIGPNGEIIIPIVLSNRKVRGNPFLKVQCILFTNYLIR